MASGAQPQPRERPIQFGKYTLMSRIATGGMGELFLAQLRAAGGFEKLVVIKRILPHLTDQREFVDMFVEEARTAARITHPNVCQIYELGQVDGRYYMALEYMEGVPLADVMVARKRAPQLADLRLVVSLVAQAAEGLHHAHSLRAADGESAQLVHRDVNPRNIFVTSAGVAKVLDFGIVKVRGAVSQTGTGSVKGTYSYMAPEQLQGEPLECTADIFSLGTIAWEAVVGRRLFKRASDLLTWKAIVEEPIPRPSQFRYDLPADLDEAIMRALARRRDHRYQSARDLALALERAIKPLGAPYTTLAISAEIEKAFAPELAEQRERVFTAHKRQEADRLGGAALDDFSEGHPDTRVADPDYGYLVATTSGIRPPVRRDPSEVPLHTPSEIHTLDDLPAVGIAQPKSGSRPSQPKKTSSRESAKPLQPLERPSTWSPESTPFGHPSGRASSALPASYELRSRSPWPMVLALLVFGTGAAALAYVLKKDGMETQPDLATAPAEAARPSPATPPPPPVEANPAATTDDAPPPVETPPAEKPDEAEEPASDEPKLAGAIPSGTREKETSKSRRERDKEREKEKEKEKEKAREKEIAREKERTRKEPKQPKVEKESTATNKVANAPKGGGFLTVNAEPYATVYVDGKKRGYTPVVRLSLPAGEHTLKLVSSAGGPDKKMKVKIVAGKEMRKVVKW
jgi:serine/threonine protein kinase